MSDKSRPTRRRTIVRGPVFGRIGPTSLDEYERASNATSMIRRLNGRRRSHSSVVRRFDSPPGAGSQGDCFCRAFVHQK